MSEDKKMLKVSSNPHVRSKMTTSMIMFAVIIALLPATGYGIYHFGVRTLPLIFATVISCVVTEGVWEKLRGKFTLMDFSAVVTGLLLALNLPANLPWWMGALGGFFAITFAKVLFGGLGQNFMNPALAGRCFLLISFPNQMTDFSNGVDAVASATPLAALKAGESVNVMDMIVGNIGGTIGETSMIAIVFGACILLLLGIIDLKIPASYIISFAIFIGLFGGRGFDPAFISAHLAGGGLMLGAFFMATDYVTRPITPKGQYLFGIFLGIMTGIFRLFGPGAEGVSYAIILGNLLVPLMEKITVPTPFGYKKGGKANE